MEEEKDITKLAYNISSYDLVYILLKDSAKNNISYKDVIRLDKKKSRYYFLGKIIEMQGYPKFLTIAFVNEKDLVEYKKAKNFREKQKYIVNIHFGDIDYINLSFDSFDWKA